MKSALTSRVNESKFFVLDELKFDEIKTKKMVKQYLDNLESRKSFSCNLMEKTDANVVVSQLRNIAESKNCCIK